MLVAFQISLYVSKFIPVKNFVEDYIYEKTHQRLIVILLTVSFLISSCMTIYAAKERDNTTIYDLTVGGMQSFLCKSKQASWNY